MINFLVGVLQHCLTYYVVKEETDTENEKYMCTVGINDDIIFTFADNPVDTCVEMIEKLYNLKML